MIDLHTHLLPGVDDGAASVTQAVSALHTMWAQGVRRIALTPHLRASETRVPEIISAHMTGLDESWDRLRSMATSWGPTLERGVELMLDVPDADLTDPRLRLGGTSYVLLEFPGMEIPPRAPEVMRVLVDRGITPVLAHPERYRNFVTTPASLAAWHDSGAVLQVNLPSLLGGHGPRPRTVAWKLLEQGDVALLASDYHARGKLRTTEALTALHHAGAEEQISLLTAENPGRILAGERPFEVPPFEVRTSLWSRLIRATISDRLESRA